MLRHIPLPVHHLHGVVAKAAQKQPGNLLQPPSVARRRSPTVFWPSPHPTPVHPYRTHPTNRARDVTHKTGSTQLMSCHLRKIIDHSVNAIYATSLNDSH